MYGCVENTSVSSSLSDLMLFQEIDKSRKKEMVGKLSRRSTPYLEKEKGGVTRPLWEDVIYFKV